MPKYTRSSIKDILKDWKWILSFTKKHIGSIVLLTLFGLLGSALSLLSGVLSKYMIDSIVSMDLDKLKPMALYMVLSAVFSVAFRSLNSRFSAKLGITMNNEVQAHVFDRLIRSDWMAISRYSTGDLLNRFSGDVNTVASCAVSWVPSFIIQAFTVLATLCVVCYYDPVMALIAFASAPVLLLASRTLMRKQRDYNRKMREASSDLSAFESEAFRNINTLKGFGVEDNICLQLHQNQERFKAVSLDYNSFSIKTNAMLSGLGTAVQYITMGYCLLRLWQGKILFGTMVLFLQQRSTLQSAFSALVGLIPRALSGSIAAERVRELTDLPKDAPVCPDPPTPTASVRLRDVEFSYNDDRKVLGGVTLHADPGEIIVLVGPSGQGKTTTLRLLLGLVKPLSGTLELVDTNGVSHPIGTSTRHWFSYVPQGNTLIAGTIADNLRLANPDATTEEMIAALQQACAWEFVSQMPGTVDAHLGEGGKGLSEGQAQRIAIARALMRKVPVLLLDEVTSALDMDTERRILRQLTGLGVTCIVTTHRPSVLTMCTRAYRVENGHITQLTDAEVYNLTANL